MALVIRALGKEIPERGIIFSPFDGKIVLAQSGLAAAGHVPTYSGFALIYKDVLILQYSDFHVLGGVV
jgi:hypothetical protein